MIVAILARKDDAKNGFGNLARFGRFGVGVFR